MGRGLLRLLALALVGFAWMAAPAGAQDDDCPDDLPLHLAGCVDLDTVMAADLQLSGAWIGATQPGRTAASAYLTILNRGEASDRLEGATSPTAGRIELWSDEQVEGGVAIDPGDTVELTPGGLHLVMHDIEGRLRAGGEVEVTLEFEKAGSVTVPFSIREPPSPASAAH